MANFCIICEFNPLHNGHAYLLRRARELGADTVTCIMSGNSTQRGELAIVDKYLRAEAAVECGADLVLELPFPWCSASADFFANAGVSIAAECGDVLLFGSECGDTQYLSEAAEYCESEEFCTLYDEHTRSGMGAAAAYSLCLSKRGFERISSNDLLGIAYIRAIKRQGCAIVPMAVKRVGASYNQAELSDGELPSATALREAVARGEIEALDAYMPRIMRDIIVREYESGRLTDIEQASAAMLGYFRLCSPCALDGVSDTDGGLSNRILSAARKSTTYEELLNNLRTKRYTDAKLRRALLFSLASVGGDMLSQLPEYTLLLGANEKGRAILSQMRRAQGLQVVTKPADAPKESRQSIASDRLDSIYGLARNKKMAADEFVRKKAYIVK